MVKNYVMVDIEDPRTSKIADAISNKTCKKILGLLSESEMSESELAGKLKLPMNTIGYNVKKLVDAGLIEKSKFLWSSRGKKINSYRLSNKKIVISPRFVQKGVIPAAFISAIAALLVKIQTNANNVVSSTKSYAAESTARGIETVGIADSGFGSGQVYQALSNAPNSWAWFLVGSLVALLVLTLWNSIRNERR